MAVYWPATLWPSSFKGAAFWMEADKENGGRRLVTHQFPKRDDPFHEDLGEDARTWDLTLYLAGDASAAAAAALTATLAQAGPGTLVLPAQGPVQARCVTFSRDRSRDRMGFIGFSAHFTREGLGAGAAAFATPDYLIQLAYDGLAAVIAAVGDLAQLLNVVDAPGSVVDAIVTGVQDIAATLENIRYAAELADDAGLEQLTVIGDLYNAIPDQISGITGVDPALFPAVMAAAQGLATAMGPEQTADAFARALDASDSDPPALDAEDVLSDRLTQDMVNRDIVARALRATLFAPYAIAAASRDYPDRPAAVTARADLAGRAEPDIARATGAAGEALALALTDLRNSAVAAISRRIANLAPVVTVSAGRVLPSIWWAWRLYGDPERAVELVERNRIKHPSHMPRTFEALAPTV